MCEVVQGIKSFLFQRLRKYISNGMLVRVKLLEFSSKLCVILVAFVGLLNGVGCHALVFQRGFIVFHDIVLFPIYVRN